MSGFCSTSDVRFGCWFWPVGEVGRTRLVHAVHRLCCGADLRSRLHEADRIDQPGVKWSSQHLERGGCDEGWETALGSVRARRLALAWSALCCAAGGSPAVLGCHRGGMLDGGGRGWGRGVASRGGTLFPEGGRHAAIPSRAIVEAAVRALSVVCRAGGDRDLARATARGARHRPPARARPVHDLA